jgi:hypothetical protein
MRFVPPRLRATLARRIAAGLSPETAARSTGLAVEVVADLMGEASFRQEIDCHSEILDQPREVRMERMQAMAQAIIDKALANGDLTPAELAAYNAQPDDDPVVTLH